MRKGQEYCDSHHIKTHLLDEKVLEVFHEIKLDPDAIEKYIAKEDNKQYLISSDSLKKQEQQLISKIEQLASTLALNNTSSAAKYIIAEIERLDQQLKDCQKQLIIATATERRASTERKRVTAKRREICSLMDNFDNFTMEEKNSIAKSVLKECIWDGSTLKIVL